MEQKYGMLVAAVVVATAAVTIQYLEKVVEVKELLNQIILVMEDLARITQVVVVEVLLEKFHQLVVLEEMVEME